MTCAVQPVPQLPPDCRGVGQKADGRRAGGDPGSAGVRCGRGGGHYGVAASSGEERSQTAAVEQWYVNALKQQEIFAQMETQQENQGIV